jgi:hypothetical protein
MPATVPSIQTPASLNAVRLEVESIASRIVAAMESMKTHGFQELRIQSGKANLTNGMNRVHHFVQVVEDTIREQRDARGDFGIVVAENGAKQDPRKGETQGG